MTPAQLVQACRVPAWVPEHTEHHRWRFEWMRIPSGEAYEVGDPRGWSCAAVALQAGLPQGAPYAALTQWTMSTLHRERGHVVMEDTPRELRRHLPILLHARGRVLVTGLGLGCVLRGLLAKPEVEHVDCVELDPWILEYFGGEFANNPRCTLHLGDALQYPWDESSWWDFAWHDVCTPEDDDGLHVLHTQLLGRYMGRARRQGAWQLERSIKRTFRKVLPTINDKRRHAWP
jgi:hypothetical protein